MIQTNKQIANYKNISEDFERMEHVEPERVHIALNPPRCKDCETYVEVGDTVAIGQTLGVSQGPFFKLPVYSTVSGTVEAFTKKVMPGGEEDDVVVIKNDFKDTMHESVGERSDEEINAMSQQEIVDIVGDKALTGLGGAAFPTHIKMGTDKPIDVVIVNGVECEPYLNSDYVLMQERPEDMFKGLRYAMQAVSAPRGVVAVKETKKKLLAMLKEEAAKHSDLDISVVEVEDFYPQGWEIATFKSVTGIDVPVGTLPMEYGILGLNSSTIIGVYDALKYNMPVIDRYVTINGDAIKQPTMFKTRIGASTKHLLDKSGGFKEDAGDVNIVMGGPMMGQSTPYEDITITQTTASLLALRDENPVEEPCVRCGSCVYSCPVDIQPVQIMNAYKKGDKKALEQLEVNKCIECGICSYVCTSKIHLTDYMRKGKNFLR